MRKLIFLLLAGLTALFSNCNKDSAEKTETITVTDTVYVEVRDTVTIPVMISDATTTFIITRHAEKETTGSDPNLNSDGVVRADELKRILSSISINAIYSTPFNRTRQTVQPLATAKGIAVTEYSASKPYGALVSDVIKENRGKVVVLVGHSNTVPDILKELSNNSFNVTISDHQYDNLFIVSVPDSLSATVTPLKYGKETP